MTYEETLAWLHSMPRKQKIPILDHTKKLLSLLGNPEKELARRFLHVTGTNGKGSACAFLTNALRVGGYRVGRFISPFIMDFEERMEINGVCISQKELTALAEKIKPAVETVYAETGLLPVEFELVTVLGLLWFAKEHCDLVVLEVGIGGTYDPTNVVEPLLSVIMKVDYDHTELLGHTLSEIAENKAGIIKAGAPCVLYADNEKDVFSVVEKRCAVVGSPLVIPDFSAAEIVSAVPGALSLRYRGIPYTLRLSGLYQLRNAVTAIEALELLPALGYPLTREQIQKGLAETTFPARFEVLSASPLVILDGAHNNSGMLALRENLDYYFGDAPILCLCGMLTDKNPEEALAPVLSLGNFAVVACITPPTPRAMDASSLAAVFRGHGHEAQSFTSIQDALADLTARQKSSGAPIICFGSLYSAGDIRRCFGHRGEA